MDRQEETYWKNRENEEVAILSIPSFEEIWDDLANHPKPRYGFYDMFDNKIEELVVYFLEECGSSSKKKAKEKTMEQVEEAKEKAMEHVKKEFEDKYYEIIENVEGIVNDCQPVYRGMMIMKPSVFIDELKVHGKSTNKGKIDGVGAYWTWDRNKAIPYWGEGIYEQTYVLLEGFVGSLEDVDFDHTFKTGMLVDGDEEREITLKKGSRLLVKTIEINHEECIVFDGIVIA